MPEFKKFDDFFKRNNDQDNLTFDKNNLPPPKWERPGPQMNFNNGPGYQNQCNMNMNMNFDMNFGMMMGYQFGMQNMAYDQSMMNNGNYSNNMNNNFNNQNWNWTNNRTCSNNYQSGSRSNSCSSFMGQNESYSLESNQYTGSYGQIPIF